MAVKNVEVRVEKNVAIIKIDLNKDFGLSGSGKTTIIGTTAGAEEIGETGIMLNLTAYKKVKK